MKYREWDEIGIGEVCGWNQWLFCKYIHIAWKNKTHTKKTTKQQQQKQEKPHMNNNEDFQAE